MKKYELWNLKIIITFDDQWQCDDDEWEISCHKCKTTDEQQQRGKKSAFRRNMCESEDIFNGIKHQIMSICMGYTNSCYRKCDSFTLDFVLVGVFFHFVAFTLRYSIFAMWIAIMPRYFNDDIKEDRDKKMNTKHYTRTTTTKRSSKSRPATASARWIATLSAYQLLKTTYWRRQQVSTIALSLHFLSAGKKQFTDSHANRVNEMPHEITIKLKMKMYLWKHEMPSSLHFDRVSLYSVALFKWWCYCCRLAAVRYELHG